MPRAEARYAISATDESGPAFRQFEDSISRVTRSAGRIRTAFSLAAVAGIGLFVQNSIRATDELQKLQVQTGLSARFLSEMRGAVSFAGVEFTRLVDAVRTVNNAVAAGVSGSAEYVRLFDALGLSAEALNSTSVDERISQVALAIAQQRDTALGAAAAAKLLGARNQELLRLYAAGPEAIQALREQEIALGNSRSQDQLDAAAAAVDAQQRIANAIAGVTDSFALSLAPAIEWVADLFQSFLLPVIEGARVLFDGLTTDIGGVAAVIGTVLTGQFSLLPAVIDEALEASSASFDRTVAFFSDPTGFTDQANADRIAAAASDRGAAVGAAFSDGFTQTMQDSDPLSTLAKQSLELLSQIEKVSAPKVGSVSGGLDSAIGALQQVISLQDELDRGAQASTGLFSRTFDSLRGTTPAVSSPEERMLRELVQLKLLFAKQSLPKVEQLLEDLKTLLAGGVPARLS